MTWIISYWCKETQKYIHTYIVYLNRAEMNRIFIFVYDSEYSKI